MLGYSLEEMSNKKWQELTHPDDIELTKNSIGELISGKKESARFIKRFIHKNGSTVWVDLSSTLRRDQQNKPLYLMSAAIDMTERVRVEQALRASEEKYRTVADFTYDWEAWRAPDGRYLYISPSCERISGHTADEFLAAAELVVQITHPDDQEMVSEHFYPTSQVDQGQNQEFDFRIRTSDGEMRWISHTCTAVYAEGGQWLGRRESNRDITARKQAEEQIRKLNAELELRVLERTAQLEMANKELEAFAYSVSHDLRAPLRAMEGFSSALLSRYTAQLDEQGRHYLNRIQQASQRMGQLINDMLNLSRITRTEFSSKSVDLCQLAHEITADLKTRDPQRQVKIVIAEMMTVQGDAQLLRIALQNLLENAWKFSSTRENANIEVGQMSIADYQLQNRSNWASHLSQAEASGQNPKSKVYFVRDNGVGFDMAFTGKLFAPFQRLHAMNEFSGTGIGLAIVQRVIARHGGQIWPDAQEGQGATFYFTLGGTA
jgi:PAS domain S-box-containing protein